MTKSERKYDRRLRAYLAECERRFREGYMEAPPLESGHSLTLTEFKMQMEIYLKSGPWRSEATEKKNRTGLKRFINFMEEMGKSEVNAQAVMDYRNSLVGLAPNTISQYIKRLSAFLNWLVDANLLKENFIPKSMKQNERYDVAKPVLKESEFWAIINPVRMEYMQKKNLRRGRAMVVLMVTSGVRRSELATITPADLDFANGKVTVRSGKGEKSRVVPFIPVAQNAVREYIEQERTKKAGMNDPLFAHEFEGKLVPYCTDQIRYITKAYIERTTGRDDLSPHSLRHSFATFLVSGGMNVLELKTVLGHSSLLTTQRYAQLLCPDEKPIEHATATFDGMMYTKHMKALEQQKNAPSA